MPFPIKKQAEENYCFFSLFLPVASSVSGAIFTWPGNAFTKPDANAGNTFLITALISRTLVVVDVITISPASCLPV